MRALTVQQPWAWAIVHADKVENRSWTTNHRGRLAIHAGKQVDEAGFDDPALREATTTASYLGDADDGRDPFPLGAIVGVGDLVDVHEATAECERGRCAPFGWFGGERNFHWVFADVIELREPVPCRGALGLWTPTPEVVLQVVERARYAA